MTREEKDTFLETLKSIKPPDEYSSNISCWDSIGYLDGFTAGLRSYYGSYILGMESGFLSLIGRGVGRDVKEKQCGIVDTSARAVVGDINGVPEAMIDDNPIGAIAGDKNVSNKMWTPDENQLKEYLNYAPIWVNLHDILIVPFTDDGRLDYARTLIKIRADWELKDAMIISILNVKDDGEVLRTIRVEYEWEPPRCGVCKIFGHDDMTCPHRVVKVPKKQSKNNDGFQQPPKRDFREKGNVGSTSKGPMNSNAIYLGDLRNSLEALKDKDNIILNVDLSTAEKAEDYDTYDTYDLEGLTEDHMDLAKAFEINLRGQIR
nr:hypothetical protein [Tanacetum cinerariifolium]